MYARLCNHPPSSLCGRYPAAARQHVHVLKAYLPVDIAKALAVDPTLIQKPVETFYTRDALQLRVRACSLSLGLSLTVSQAAHKMSRFPPEPSVLSVVKMTRAAYAQLVGQKFYPPKVFGRWQEQEGTKEWRWHDIGMKIVRFLKHRHLAGPHVCPRRAVSR